MLSIETESRVAKVLVALGQGEQCIEMSRKSLCDSIEFNPYKIFQVLDLDEKNRIDSYNLTDFLKRRGIFGTFSEIQFIIRYYDKDCDGSWSVNEFLNFVQSSNYRSNSKISASEKIPYYIESSLKQLIQKELALAKKLSVMICDVKSQHDFDIHEIFHLMKSWNTITSDSLKSFFRRNLVKYFENDIQAIIKRLDVNLDGEIDLIEFSSFFGCPICTCGICSYCICSCCNDPVQCCSLSSYRGSRSMEKNNTIRPMVSSQPSAFKSTFQTSSPQTNDYTFTQSPEVKKITSSLSLRLSPERNFSPIKLLKSPALKSQLKDANKMRYNRSSSMKNSNEEKQLVDFFSLLMDEENNIEAMKIDLAMRNDFNVEDAFRIFEREGKEYLTEDDLNKGLSLLDIKYTKDDIKVLMKRFGLKGKGLLSYGDFFDMIVPYEKKYRSMVENRQPNSCCPCRSLKAFSNTTKKNMQSLLNIILVTEREYNILQGNFDSLISKLKGIFHSIDVVNKGFFTEMDLERYLKRKQAFTSVKDTNLLFIHLDKDRNGQVEYWELQDALSSI